MRARSCSLVCLSLQPLWTHTQAPLMVEAGPLELAATRAAALTRDVGSEDRTSYVASDAERPSDLITHLRPSWLYCDILQ